MARRLRHALPAANGPIVTQTTAARAARGSKPLGWLVEMPAAVLVVAEIVVLLAGVVSRYVCTPADLVGRTGLDPVPLAGDAGRGRSRCGAASTCA
jgi:hypothetical protein